MPTFSVPATAPAKKTSNRRKNVVDADLPVPMPEPMPEPMPAPVTTDDNDNDNDNDTAEPESPVSEPTFPNMVILKQTDHNYIVKHNHYPVSVS